MRTRHLLAVVLLCIFMWLITLPLAIAQEGTTVVVTTQPGQPPGPIVLQMPASEISTTYSLYLLAETPRDNVSFSSYLQNADQQVMAETVVEFVGANGQPLGTFNLPAGQSRIGMRITNLTQHGMFTGTVGLQSAATPLGYTPIATFTLNHPAQAQVEVKPADAQNLIALQATSPDFYYPLTILETGGQSDADVHLTLGPVTRKDAVAGLPAELHFDASQAVTTSVVISRGNYTVVAIAGQLPEQAAYTSWLMLQHNNQTAIYTLDLSRTVAGGIVVLDAVNGQITLPVSAANFDRVLMFQVASNQPTIADLRVALTDPPIRSDGQSVISESLTCSACTNVSLQNLNPGQLFTITLSGRNFQATTYSSPLRFNYQNQIQSVPLVITRAQPRLTFSVTNPISVTGINFLPPNYVDVGMQIADTSGVETLVYYPASEGAQLLLHGKNDMLPTWSPAPTDTFVLPANGSADFTLRWSGLDAGAYIRSIRVAGPNSAPIVQSVTINVKDSIFLAFAAIFAGVYASYWIQRRTRGGRTRDLRSAEIARMRQTLQAQPPDPIWTELLARVERLEWDNRLRTDLTDDALAATLNDLRSRAENYRQALVANKRALELLEAFPIRTTGLQQKKREFEQEQTRLLQGIQSALLLPEKQGLGNDATDAPPQVKDLFKLFDRIRDAAIREPTLTLQKQLADFGKDNPDLAKDNQVFDDSTAQVEDILTALGSSKFNGLTEQLEKARQGYATLQLQALQQAIDCLETDQKAAPNAQSQDWQAVNAFSAAARAAVLRAGQLTTADEQLRVWEEARHDHLRALIAHLVVLVSPAGRPSGSSDSAWQQAVNDVPTLGDALKRAQQAAQSNEWELAEVSYQKAREEYAKVQSNLLKSQVASFKTLFDQAPDKMPPASDWNAAREKLTPTLGEFDAIQQLATDPAQLMRARLEFVKKQIAIWKDLLDWAQGDHQAALPDEWQALKRTVPDVDTAQLEDVQQLINAEIKLSEARQAYQTIRGPLAAPVSYGRPGAPGLIEEMFGSLGSALRNLVGTVGEFITVPSQGLLAQLTPYEEQVARTPEDWYRQVERNDRLQAALVLVVATITGLVALWINNPTFGGSSYLLALLWGFGLNEAAQGFLKIATDNGVLPVK